MTMRFLLTAIIICGFTSFLILFFANFYIESRTNELVFSEIEEVPFRKVGLLLGTSKTLPNGMSNLYYEYRIQAAVILFKTHKIEYILISGDNGTKAYSEPEDMQADLIRAGVPSEKIFLDFAGFRTFDSYPYEQVHLA
jgi:SanA protein